MKAFFYLVTLVYSQTVLAVEMNEINPEKIFNHNWKELCDWKSVEDTDDTPTWSCDSPGSSLQIVRSESTFKASGATLYEILTDSNKKPDWVQGFSSAQQIWMSEDKMKFREYVIYDMPFPISDRDYIYENSISFSSDMKSLNILIRSVEDKRGPQDSIGIRGWTTFAAYRLIPKNEGKETFVETLIHTDPKGWLPSWLVNMLIRKFPAESAAGMREQIQKNWATGIPEIQKMWEEILANTK